MPVNRLIPIWYGTVAPITLAGKFIFENLNKGKGEKNKGRKEGERERKKECR